ncbi:hypothetical protein A8990_115104 [Paenibacillus taihuensis]|uniref:Uncharacterized protein n=1 Tax=Paenibacillus taihuensis TaxID=1156355 RepID=A0A3D9S550_9BACL|nr:hypothetical protein A8990_115104 [Paenibacillus taihuensis]
MLVGALEQIVASEYVLVEKKILYEELKPGMVLLSPVINRSGVKLLPVGIELTENQIQNILSYYRDHKLLLSTVSVMDYKSK